MKKKARDLHPGDVVPRMGEVVDTFIAGSHSIVVWFKKRGVTTDLMFPIDHLVEVSEPVPPKE